MATTTSLRIRRNEAQLHALAGVEREIRVSDPTSRRKYLQDYSEAFCTYDAVLNSEQLKSTVAEAGVVLIGDYHALPAAQRFAAALFEERAQPGDRPVVLGVETIFARDQHILDEWWRREIEDAELRQRIRFDIDWGYAWEPFYRLLVTAREHGEHIYALDCMPREDLRKIGARDRHAAHKISEMRQRHPEAAILVLFGESHLAPGHLPHLLREQMPQERILSVLQNVDALYWHAAGEQRERVEAVRVADDVVCVFNSTPLEKYENYRLHLSRWRSSEDEGPDLAPTIYNLIDSLIRFLDINLYSARNGTQPKFLVDLLPEVYCGVGEARARRLMARESEAEEQQAALLRQVEEQGCVYLSRMNVFYVREFQMMYAAEEAARFLHYACRGLLRQPGDTQAEDLNGFYTRVLEHALGYFGSRVLYPVRAAAPGELSRELCDEFAESALRTGKLDENAKHLGYLLGRELYDLYLAGVVSRSKLRNMFVASLREFGRAREICLEIAELGHANHRARVGHKRPKPVRTVLAHERRTTG